MKKYLGLLLLLVSFTSFGQFSNYTNINGRYKWIAGKFDSTFTIPSGTTPSLRVGGGTGPGALFYSTTDSTVYQYTGTRWTRLRGTDTAHVVSAYVRNTTASTMTAGQVVYINGSTGTTPTIALAVNTADSTSAMTFGFVRGTIAPNGFGWITTFGPLEGVNTNAYTEGEVIYLDSIPGQFTHDKPQAPYHMVTLGYIVKKSGGNGTIFAKIQNGYELEELHNVRITSPVRNNAILAYDSVAKLWKDTTLSAIGGVTGSGTSGQVAYWTGTSSQSGSNNLFWDNANNRLGIGTNAPANTLDVNGTARIQGQVTSTSAGFMAFYTSPQISLRNAGSGNKTWSFIMSNNDLQIREDGIGFPMVFKPSGNIITNQNGGNFIINSTTDGGQRLQVTGDVLFRGSGNTSGTTALTVQNSDGTAILRTINDGRLYLGNLNFAGMMPTNDGTGTPNLSGLSIRFLANTSTQSQSNFYFRSVNNLSATSGNQNGVIVADNFSPTSGTATFTNLVSQPVINQTGGANGITRGLYVNPTLTAAADWRSIEWSNNSGWGLYGAGSANNYLNGSLGIGSTSFTGMNLSVNKNITGSANAWGIYVDGSIQNDVNTTGRLVQASASVASGTSLPQLYYFYARQNTFTGTVTNQSGFRVDNNLTGATNNYGFFGDLSAATGRWNLFMNGTANNYLNGSLGIGTTSLTHKLNVFDNTTYVAQFRGNNSSYIIAGDVSLAGESGVNFRNSTGQAFLSLTSNILNIIATSGGNTIAFSTSGTEAGRFTSSQNLLLGSTTDGGQKLQVNGDTRLTGSGNTSATTALTIRNSDAITMLRILNDGELRLGNAGSSAPIIYTSDQSSGFGFDLNGRDLVFNARHTTQEASNGMFGFTGSTSTVTTGTSQVVNISRNFEPTSGTAVFNYLQLRSIINQTGGANGITRGLYVNPTLTSAADWRSLEWSNNTGKGIWGVGTADNAMAGSLRVGSASSANASAILELSSTTKGFLPPRMTGTEAEAIASPVAGLLVFITNGNGTTITSVGWWGYDSSGWVKLN